MMLMVHQLCNQLQYWNKTSYDDASRLLDSFCYSCVLISLSRNCEDLLLWGRYKKRKPSLCCYSVFFYLYFSSKLNSKPKRSAQASIHKLRIRSKMSTYLHTRIWQKAGKSVACMKKRWCFYTQYFTPIKLIKCSAYQLKFCRKKLQIIVQLEPLKLFSQQSVRVKTESPPVSVILLSLTKTTCEFTFCEMSKL